MPQNAHGECAGGEVGVEGRGKGRWQEALSFFLLKVSTCMQATHTHNNNTTTSNPARKTEREENVHMCMVYTHTLI